MAEVTNQKSETLEAVPSSWPGGFGLYKYSREAVKTNWQVLLGLIALSFGVGIALGILTVPLQLINSQSKSFEFVARLITDGIGNLISFYISLSTLFVILYCSAREEISFEDALKKPWEFFLKYIIMSILAFFIILGSIIAFVIPVFFVAPRVFLSGYYLLDQKLSPTEAIKASWRETKGHVGKVYGILGVNIAITLLIFTIVGIPFAIYFFFMYQAASAVLYRYIIRNPATPTTTS